MSGARLHAVEVATRDLPRARRLWCDLLGGTEVDGGSRGLDVVLPPGVMLSLRPADGEPGVVGVTLAVADPAAVAGEAAARVGVATRREDEGIVLDTAALLGGPVGLVPDDATAEPPVVPGGGAAGVTGLDHACFGVRDLARSSDLLQALGGRPVFGGDSPYGIRSLHLAYDVGKLELLSPLRDDSEVARHLERRGGPAPHHVTLLVADVARAETAAHELGFDTTWTDLEHETWRDTYLRPGTTDGVVVQLATTTRAYPDTLSAEDYQRVFEGYWWVAHHQMRPFAEVSS